MFRLLLSTIMICVIQLVCVAQTSIGFRALTRVGDSLAACGDGDGIVMLDAWGRTVSEIRLPASADLYDIAAGKDALLAVGKRGTIVYISGGEAELNVISGEDILCVDSFRGEFLLGMDNALVRLSSQLDLIGQVQPGVRGKITSLSCSESGIVGSTDLNEVFCSQDGQKWKVVDFNSEYKSYYSAIDITSVAYGESSMAIAGRDESGLPAMYFSADGTVWSEREMSYLDHGTPVSVSSLPSALAYDRDNDRMLLLLENGDVLAVPGCSHCNSLEKTGLSGLKDMEPVLGGFVAVGDHARVYSSLNR